MPTEWSVRAITRATLPILLVLTVVELGSGLVLGRFETTLLRYPALLVLVPVTIGSAGNLGSILAARLSTAFHLGTLSFDDETVSITGDEELLGNAVATVLLSLTIFPVIGVGAWALSVVTAGGGLSVVTVVVVAVVSGVVLGVVAVVVAVVATYAAYRLELDPDDVAIPVVTNTCDVLGVVVLFVVAQLLVPV